MTEPMAEQAHLNSMSNDSIQVYVSLAESVTHLLNELSLAAIQQEVNTYVLSNEFMGVFMQYCDDMYSSGASDINLNVFSKILLKLQSTSLAAVGTIQQTKTNALQKVLFDSGSGKTIVKRSSLPSGIEASTGKKGFWCECKFHN
jgi:hypothetical protein